MKYQQITKAWLSPVEVACRGFMTKSVRRQLSPLGLEERSKRRALRRMREGLTSLLLDMVQNRGGKLEAWSRWACGHVATTADPIGACHG